MTYPTIIETRRGNPYAPKVVRPAIQAKILELTDHIGRGTL